MRLWLLSLVGVALAGAIATFVPIPMGVTHVRTEVDIDRPPHDVFTFVSTPATWPRWHPSSIAVTGDAGHSLAIGESVVEEFTVAGRHGFAEWRVIAREPDRRWSIEGRINGQVSGVVTYTVSERPGGTHFVRQFDYPSRTILFAIVNAVYIHARVVEESERATAKLKTVTETD